MDYEDERSRKNGLKDVSHKRMYHFVVYIANELFCGDRLYILFFLCIYNPRKLGIKGIS